MTSACYQQFHWWFCLLYLKGLASPRLLDILISEVWLIERVIKSTGEENFKFLSFKKFSGINFQ